MRQNHWIWQSVVCLAIFAAVHSGMGAVTMEKYEKIGILIEKIAAAIQENYTLAELLQLGEDAASKAVSAPAKISEAILSANEKSFYGKPLDDKSEASDGTVQPVYAAAGGRVLKSGLQDGLGLYVMVEHEKKISTYGHLSSIRVVAGDRIVKGEILGSFDRTCGEEFYYSLEEKSRNFT